MSTPIMVDDPALVPEVVADILEADLLCVDTEFHSERRYFPQLYLVQVYRPGGKVWVLDALVHDVLDGVAEAMLSRPWLVHGGEWDMKLLNRRFGSLPEIILDTQIGAGLCSSYFPARYGQLVEWHTEHDVDKSQTLSDWSRRPLSEAQMGYAAGDVLVLRDVWDAIVEKLERLDRVSLAYEACAAAKDLVLNPPSVDERWRSVQGVRGLSPPQAAVLQELAGWRELTARENNQPVRSVANDGVLTWLARNQPLTLQGLATRKIPKALMKRHGPALLECISRSSQRPEWAHPRPIRRYSLGAARAAWLDAWAQSNALQNSWGHRLVLPSDLIERLAESPSETEAELHQRLGWRTALIGESLWSALAKGESLPWPN